jgi:hypothetical protein
MTKKKEVVPTPLPEEPQGRYWGVLYRSISRNIIWYKNI